MHCGEPSSATIPSSVRAAPRCCRCPVYPIIRWKRDYPPGHDAVELHREICTASLADPDKAMNAAVEVVDEVLSTEPPRSDSIYKFEGKNDWFSWNAMGFGSAAGHSVYVLSTPRCGQLQELSHLELKMMINLKKCAWSSLHRLVLQYNAQCNKSILRFKLALAAMSSTSKWGLLNIFCSTCGGGPLTLEDVSDCTQHIATHRCNGIFHDKLVHDVVLQLLDPVMQQFRDDRMTRFLIDPRLEKVRFLMESMRKPERPEME